MEFIELKSQARETTGKGPARTLRRDGMVPGILYGPETKPMLLSVDALELERAIKKSKIGQVLVNLTLGDGSTKPAMIKELQRNPITRSFVHVDFYEISMDRKLVVRVPVKTKGKSKGAELGGMLQIIRRELEVSCLPSDVPEAIVIDITELDMGESVHVKEIPREGDIDFPAEVNFTVLTVLSPKGKAEAAEEDEEAEGEDEEAAA